MQWVALMLVGFLILGLRRSMSRANSVGVVAVAAAVLLLWFTQMSTR